MDTRNVIAAISLSAAVIILWSLYFSPSPEEAKILKTQQEEKQLVQEMESPKIEQEEKSEAHPERRRPRDNAINPDRQESFCQGLEQGQRPQKAKPDPQPCSQGGRPLGFHNEADGQIKMSADVEGSEEKKGGGGPHPPKGPERGAFRLNFSTRIRVLGQRIRHVLGLPENPAPGSPETEGETAEAGPLK